MQAKHFILNAWLDLADFDGVWRDVRNVWARLVYWRCNSSFWLGEALARLSGDLINCWDEEMLSSCKVNSQCHAVVLLILEKIRSRIGISQVDTGSLRFSSALVCWWKTSTRLFKAWGVSFVNCGYSYRILYRIADWRKTVRRLHSNLSFNIDIATS